MTSSFPKTSTSASTASNANDQLFQLIEGLKKEKSEALRIEHIHQKRLEMVSNEHDVLQNALRQLQSRMDALDDSIIQQKNLIPVYKQQMEDLQAELHLHENMVAREQERLTRATKPLAQQDEEFSAVTQEMETYIGKTPLEMTVEPHRECLEHPYTGSILMHLHLQRLRQQRVRQQAQMQAAERILKAYQREYPQDKSECCDMDAQLDHDVTMVS